jgi:hypothetical protein
MALIDGGLDPMIIARLKHAQFKRILTHPKQIILRRHLCHSTPT